MIISESPNLAEINKGSHFVGAAGDILRKVLKELGFHSRYFSVLNSVQCKTIYDLPNKGKPEYDQLNECKNYIRKYIKVINPEKIICLGNYAKYIFTGTTTGILRERGIFNTFGLGSGYSFPVLFTVHPAFCVFNEDGLPLLKEDFKLFKKADFEIMGEFIKEHEFMI
jgi:DNA polymerase